MSIGPYRAHSIIPARTRRAATQGRPYKACANTAGTRNAHPYIPHMIKIPCRKITVGSFLFEFSAFQHRLCIAAVVVLVFIVALDPVVMQLMLRSKPEQQIP